MIGVSAQHNRTQHNKTEQDRTQQNTTGHNTIEHNTTQHNIYFIFPQVVANVHLSHSVVDTYEYQVHVRTGMWKGSGTTANVGLVIYGENGCTDVISLTDPNKVFFSRGSVNNFTVLQQETLGPLVKVAIWHDDSGKSPAWFLEEILVLDIQTGEEWHFIGRRWLAVERGSGELKAEIKVADKTQLLSFRNLVYVRMIKSLMDDHLWLSLFTRPPHNPFTRCQRLSCCLSIVYTNMVVNAMFYQFGTSAKDTFRVGPLQMSWTLLKIGIQSSLIAIPINVLTLFIFRSTRESNDYPFLASETVAGQNVQKVQLPHCCIHIGWTLSLTASSAAASLTVFYSLMWGADTANLWLTSVLASIIWDVLFTQPLKVLLVASLLSLVRRKVPHKDVVVGASLWTESDVKSECAEVKAPEGQELVNARAFRRKVLKMSTVIVEVVFFFSFIVLLMIVCYGNRSSSRYLLTKSLQEIFGKHTKVSTYPLLEFTWSSSKHRRGGKEGRRDGQDEEIRRKE